MTTMALAMICNSLVEASFAMNSKNNPELSKKTITEAYAFIQGTSLEITIKRFHLDLNANRLRQEFNRIFNG
jgi:cystathionine beta-lyase family protein involved in aluminum resistance